MLAIMLACLNIYLLSVQSDVVVPSKLLTALVSCRCVSTAVLYGVHALISGVLTYKTHCIRQLVRNMPQLDI